ncbi:unnamed protein product [Lampetra fluviatilis]
MAMVMISSAPRSRALYAWMASEASSRAHRSVSGVKTVSGGRSQCQKKQLARGRKFPQVIVLTNKRLNLNTHRTFGPDQPPGPQPAG